MSYVAIAAQLEAHRNTVSNGWKAYQAEGVLGIQSQTRGHKPGEQSTLSPRQEKQIQALLCDQTPEQYKLGFALWTRQAVQALLRQRLHRTMSLRTVGEYLKRWGFTPQKPLKRAYEQRPAQVRRWLDETYPAIVAREKAEIHWGDETGLRSDSQHGRRYAPKGRTPVCKACFDEYGLNGQQPGQGSLYGLQGSYEREAAAAIFEAAHQDIRA